MWRVGTVPYLNALPLVEGLDEEPGVELVREVPTRLAPRLRAGDLDVALVSAVELFRRPRLGWLAGPAVTSDGPVRSILLYLATAPEAVRSVALDSSSLTAAVLAQVCLRTFLGCEPLEVRRADPHLPPDEVPCDAVLRIGDPALTTRPGRRAVLDLGALWTERTGLPFVYALWLTRPGLDLTELRPQLLAARDRGLERRDELADAFAAGAGLDPAPCREYLRTHIGFDMGPRHREGLARYGREAHALGLVDEADLPPESGGA